MRQTILRTGEDELSNSLGGAGTIFLYILPEPLSSPYGLYRRDFFMSPSPRRPVLIPYPNAPVNNFDMRGEYLRIGALILYNYYIQVLLRHI